MTTSNSLSSPRFTGSSDFRQDKKKYINNIDDQTLRSAYVRLWVKGFIMISWFVASYYATFSVASIWFLVIPMVVIAGFGLAGMAFNVSHDFNHGAGRSKTLHKAWWAKPLEWSGQVCFDAIGMSSKLWRAKHNIAHHTYTNVAEHDSDIEQAPFMRLQPFQDLRPWYRFQQYYGWLMYGFVPVRWMYIGDPANLLKKRIASSSIGKMSVGDHFVFWGGKLFAVCWMILIPWLVLGHSLIAVLAIYFAVSFIAGVILAVVFQLAHAIDGAEFVAAPDGDIEAAFEIHQVETTRDFHYGGRFLNRQINWVMEQYLGGLNHQTIHHVFPKIPHTMYASMQSDFALMCAKNDVEYVDHTLSVALKNHFVWLKRMGTEPPVPTRA